MMKKLVYFFAVIAFALTGCDPAGIYSFNMKNGTQSDMVVEVEGRELVTVTIRPGEKETISVIYGGIGSAGDIFNKEMIMSDDKVKINGIPMPETIWLREYWEYKHTNRSTFDGQYTYTLTITDELIESIRSEEL